MVDVESTHGCVDLAAGIASTLSQGLFLRPVLCEFLLEIGGGLLELLFLDTVTTLIACGTCALWSVVAVDGAAFGLSSKELVADALVMGLHDVFGDTLHAENLDVRGLAVGKGILDSGQVLLVDLIHVHRQTCGG